MSESNTLLIEDNDSVRTLTLNRPKNLNALNESLIRNLVSAVASAHMDEKVNAIVITGNEKAFSAGADLKEAAARKSENQLMARRKNETARAFYQLSLQTDKPLVAAVRGYALGGGCNLAISTDLVVAGENAIFGYPEVKIGMAATMVTPRLVHHIGAKAAFEMLVLAENISAQEALKNGLINKVVPDDRTLEEAIKIAQAISCFDPVAVRTTKRLFEKSKQLPLSQSLEVAAEAMLELRALNQK